MTSENEGKSNFDSKKIEGYNSTEDNIFDSHIANLNMELQKAQDNFLQLQELKKRLEDARSIRLERAVHEEERKALHQLKSENEQLKNSVSLYKNDIDSVRQSITDLKKSLAEGMQLFQSKILDSLDMIENNNVATTQKFYDSVNAMSDELDIKENLFNQITEKIAAKDNTADEKSSEDNFFKSINSPVMEKSKREAISDFFNEREEINKLPENDPVETENTEENLFNQNFKEEKIKDRDENEIIEEKQDSSTIFNNLSDNSDVNIVDFENRINAIREKISQIEDVTAPIISTPENKTAEKQATKEQRIKKSEENSKEISKKEAIKQARIAKIKEQKQAKIEAKLAKKQLKLDQAKAKAEKIAQMKQAKIEAKLAKKDSTNIKDIKKAINPDKVQDEKSFKKVKPDTSVGKLVIKMATFIVIVFIGGLTYQIVNADKVRNAYIDQTKAVLANNPVEKQTPNGSEEDPTEKYASAYFDIAYDGTVWDTFNDISDMKISIMYPKNTTYKVKKTGSPNLWFLRRDSYLFKIDYIESESTLKDYITSQNLVIKYKQEDTTYQGYPAVKMTLQEDVDTKGDMYYVKVNNRIYRIWYKTFTDAENQDDAKRVKKMLDSVQFTATDPGTSTKKAQTATNATATKPEVSYEKTSN